MKSYFMATKFSKNIYFLKEELKKEEMEALSAYAKFLNGRHIVLKQDLHGDCAVYCVQPEIAEKYPEMFKETRCLEEPSYFVFVGGLSRMYCNLLQIDSCTDKAIAGHLEKSGVIGVTQAIYLQSIPTEIEVASDSLKRISFCIR